MLKLLGKLRPYWLRILLLVAITLAGVYTDLALPSLMARIINQGIAAQDFSLILLTGGEMLLCALLGVLCAVGSGILGAQVSMGFGRDLRGLVFRKAAALSSLLLSQRRMTISWRPLCPMMIPMAVW